MLLDKLGGGKFCWHGDGLVRFLRLRADRGIGFRKTVLSIREPGDGHALTFATFGVGFVARPVGGIVFGHFGDKIGRKAMLVLTLILMGLGTAAIGILPTYDQVGVGAPLLLVTLRFIQGFAVGGEWGGAALMAVEHAPEAKRGFFGSFVQIGSPRCHSPRCRSTWSSPGSGH
jgi:MFS family permease